MSDVLQKTADSYKPDGRLDPEGFQRSKVDFYTYAPPADLALFIDHFWTLAWSDLAEPYYSEEVMQRPYVDIYVSAEESGVQGTFRGKRTYVAAGSGRIIGVRFRPGAFHLFWSGVMADLQDKNIALTEIFPEADKRYTDALLRQDDAGVIQNLITLLRAKHPPLDHNIELIDKIISAVEHDENLLTVRAVAKASGRSERWLQQLFQDYVGIGLKWLLQRQKLLAAAQQIRGTAEPDWTAIAYDLGYSSQQHFITDFKKVLDKTPLQYKKGLEDRSVNLVALPDHSTPLSQVDPDQ